MTLRTITLAGVALFGIVPAHAADLPVRVAAPARVDYVATPSWTGFYVGLFAGYGWGRARASEPFDSNTGFFYNFTGNAYRFDTSGFLGGGTIGYNVQSGAFVYGLEGEVGYLGLRGSAIDPNGTATGTPDTETKFRSDVYGAITGRFGLTSARALFYGKGGAAFLNARASTIDPCVAPPATCGTGTLNMTGNKVMVGWTAGGGLEWMFGPNWSAKAEYAYFDFGRIETAGPSNVPGEFYRQNIRVTAHTAKAGINYRFGGGPVIARY
jgi:outer membrane immunogenic protein